MPRALQTSGTVLPEASSPSASRSLRMICSGEWRMRFIGSPPALSGEKDSHTGWLKIWGAGHDDRQQGPPPELGAVVVATPQHRPLQVAELVEDEQGVVAGAAEVAVVGGP